MENSKLEYALKYVGIDWAVLPVHWITDKGICSCGKSDCKPAGKHPLISNGFKGASKDPEKIKEWWNQWPNANIGVATGAVSDIFALDIDPRYRGDESLDRLRTEHGKIPDDCLQITGSGGAHYIYKYPGEVGRSTTNLYPGIDTRGVNGYIIVEPSNHISGNDYFWDHEGNPLTGAIPGKVPGWLLAKLSEKNHSPGPTNQPTAEKKLSDSEIKKIRAALGYVPADDRDQWRTVGMALHSTAAGEQAFGLWCEWSGQSDKFDIKDQRRVWDSFKPDGGINLGKLFHIAKHYGYVIEPDRRPEPPLESYADDLARLSDTTTKTRKPRTKKTTNPLNGDNAESVLEIIKRHVYVKNRDRIYDKETRNELTTSGFDHAFCHMFIENKVSWVILNDPEFVKVDDLIYLPGSTKNPVTLNGSLLWNIYLPPSLDLPDDATNDDVKPWTDHLTYLYPDVNEQKHFLDWSAWILQHPEDKINHCMVIGGPTRVGKDMLLNPIRHGVGEENVCEPSAEDLKEPWTDYYHHIKLVIFQEIKTLEGFNLENKLKPLLADPPAWLYVKRKHEKPYKTPNLVQSIFMSNHKDALHISAEGRYFALWTDAIQQDPEYYTNLKKWQDDGGNAKVVRWLLKRPLSNFEAKGNPPSSKFLIELLEGSKTACRLKIEEMIAGFDAPFHVDIVRSIDIEKPLGQKFSITTIGAVLRKIDCISKKCALPKVGGKRGGELSLFAVRNQAEWKQKDSQAWLTEYERRLAGK